MFSSFWTPAVQTWCSSLDPVLWPPRGPGEPPREPRLFQSSSRGNHRAHRDLRVSSHYHHFLLFATITGSLVLLITEYNMVCRSHFPQAAPPEHGSFFLSVDTGNEQPASIFALLSSPLSLAAAERPPWGALTYAVPPIHTNTHRLNTHNICLMSSSVPSTTIQRVVARTHNKVDLYEFSRNVQP